MSAPAFAHRGVMLDLARLIERHDYYFSLLPLLKSWGFNLLHLHFTDDQNCALEFPSHPELSSPHAFSVEEMREFCAEARRYGLEVVPEVECFGHTGFITQVNKYRHLKEDLDGVFSGMCVFTPEAQALLKDLLRDTAEIFEPRLLHAGLDEVSFGTHPVSAKLLKKKTRAELFADHVEWIHEVINGAGVRMAMWGDHLLKDKTGVLAERTPRDTVIFDWHYQANWEPRTLEFFIEHGFEVYGAPATQFTYNRVLSNTENFTNLRRFSGAALSRRRRRGRKGFVSGMVNTIWCPYRYVAGTIEYPLAVAGMLFSREGPEQPGFAAKFARSYWGLTGAAAADAGQALAVLHHLSPSKAQYDRLVFGSAGHNPADRFSRCDQYFCQTCLPPVRAARATLKKVRPEVKRRVGTLDDYLTAAEFITTLYRFGARERQGDPGWKRLHRLLRRSWARTRYEDGPHFSGRNAKPLGPADKRDPFRYYGGIMRDLNHLAGV